MALTVTSNYAGKAAGELFTKTFFDLKTVSKNLVTFLPGVKDSIALTLADTTQLLQADGCSWNQAGTVALTEKSLTPTALKINAEACYNTLEQHWLAESIRPGANATAPVEFVNFIIDHFIKKAGQELETIIWQGDTAGSGLVTLMDGYIKKLLADATVVDVTHNAALSASNILTEMAKVYSTIPAQLFMQPDLKLYVSYEAGRYYTQALATASGNANFNIVDGINTLTYLGIPVETVNMNRKYMVAARSSNLFLATDLISDFNEIATIDMRGTTGADEIRFKARMKAGVDFAYGSEVVLYTTTA